MEPRVVSAVDRDHGQVLKIRLDAGVCLKRFKFIIDFLRRIRGGGLFVSGTSI